MRSNHSFGIHFITRQNQKGNRTIYARIVLDKTRCELGLKQSILKEDWSSGKGAAKPRTPALKQLNTYLEEVRGKLVSHYRQLNLDDAAITAEDVKNSYLGKNAMPKPVQMTLNRLVALHNEMMEKVLSWGTMKNYYSTGLYLQKFMAVQFSAGDIPLNSLTFQFITRFEHYIRTSPLKSGDPCTNNGTMKHLERLKKMITWAHANEWIDKDPFAAYKLRFKRHEMQFLDRDELERIESRELENPMLRQVRDLFIFSCYTGLAYVDLFALKPANIITAVDGMKWIKTARKKTEIPVNIPLLTHAILILEKFSTHGHPNLWETLFPPISNQEVNRSLKLIGEICEIKKYLTFHLARHTFATTVTLQNGVPIETISKLLGHTKLSTTMVYAHVVQSKIGLDMKVLEDRLNLKTPNYIAAVS